MNSPNFESQASNNHHISYLRAYLNSTDKVVEIN